MASGWAAFRVRARASACGACVRARGMTRLHLKSPVASPRNPWCGPAATPRNRGGANGFAGRGSILTRERSVNAWKTKRVAKTLRKVVTRAKKTKRAKLS
jgi:hypothetical protein